MKFEPISFEKWKEIANAQLGSSEIEEYATEIENGVFIKPIYTEQNVHSASSFESKIQLLSSIKYENPFGDAWVGTIGEFVSKGKNKGFVSVQSMQEIREIEETSDSNEFTYLLDLFYEYETQQDALSDLEGAYSLYETFADSVQDKIRFVINVAIHQNSGASVTQQLSIALAKLNDLMTYFSPLVLSKVTFELAVGEQYLSEIAKLRALRMLVQSFVTYVGQNSIPVSIIASSTTLNKTKREDENNLIRSTLEISAAILGGASYFKFHPYSSSQNESWANEVSLKQGLILSHESLLAFYNDAMAGGYVTEEMSLKLAEASWGKFQEIEANKGYLNHFEILVNEIQQELVQYIERINKKEKIIVGYNQYESDAYKEMKAPKLSSVLEPYRLP